MSITLSNDQQTDKAWLGQLFSQYQERLNGHSQDPIALFRKRGYELLEGMDFPTRRDEDWKYTDVQKMLKQRYAHGTTAYVTEDTVKALTFDSINAIPLVFINGNLSPEHSNLEDLPEGLHIHTVKDAVNDPANREWMQELSSQEGSTKQNTFVPLNLAFASNGYYIEVEPKAQIERPVHFIHINVASDQPHFSNPQLFVKVNKGASATVIESYHGNQDSAEYFTNAASWIDVAPNAQLTHYRLQFEHHSAFQVHNTFVRQRRDSRYSNHAVDLGGKMVRNNLSTELLDSNTETNYYGLYLGNSAQHIDNQTFIDHAVPHCESNELYKGILMDQAKGVFNGKVLVRQDAQKTNAYQQNSSLVLSDDAQMNAKPQLEIYADDVKCSHGATIGQLDEGAVFYLRTRGIPHQEARNLLQQAFLAEVVKEIPHEEIATYVQQLTDQKLNA